MPGDSFVPNPAADEETQQPELTGVGSDPKAFAHQMFKQRFDAIHTKYKADEDVIRSASMPSTSVIQEEMAAELAGLKEMYKAKNEDLYSGDPINYKKRLGALKSSYHADQFRTKQRYDKQLREENRAYDSQRAQLEIRKNQELDQAEKRSSYDIGRMHAIDELIDAGHITSDVADAAKWNILGVNVPKPVTPEQRFSQTSAQLQEVNEQLGKYQDVEEYKGLPLIGKDVPASVQIIEGRGEYGQPLTRPALAQDLIRRQNLRSAQVRLQDEQVKYMGDMGLLDPTQVRAKQQVGGGGLRASKTKTADMESNVNRGPSQTVAQKQQDVAKPKKLTKETANYFYVKAGRDLDLAKRMAAAAGYKE